MASAPLLYVFEDASNVRAFRPTDSGNTAPYVLISGGSTSLTGAEGGAIDSSGNLWVADASNNAIYMFAAGVTGNVAPSVTISGASTTLTQPSTLAFDSVGNLWCTNTGNAPTPLLRFNASVLVAGGNVAPDRSISGNLTHVGGLGQIAVDATGNIYYAGGNNSAVYIFGPTANGNVAPSSTISGSNNFGTDTVPGLALDSNNNIYVVDQSASSVMIFNVGNTSGNATPNATLSGAATGLSSPHAICLDINNFIYVLQASNLKYWNAGSTGNTPPNATISGAATGIVNTTFMTIWNAAPLPAPDPVIAVFNNDVFDY